MSEHHFKGHKDENYEVGYRKPPQQHQFQKGNKLSRGRKAGSKNIRTVIEEEAFALISYVDQSGVTMRAPAIQLAVRRQVKSALQGDLKAAEFISKQVNVHCPPPVLEGEEEELSDVERRLLADHIALEKMLKGVA